MDDESHVERFGCPNCHRSYKHRKHLYRHLRQGCDEMTTKTTAGRRDGQPSHMPFFRCSFCSYTTYLKASLLQHAQLEHNQDCPCWCSSSNIWCLACFIFLVSLFFFLFAMKKNLRMHREPVQNKSVFSFFTRIQSFAVRSLFLLFPNSEKNWKSFCLIPCFVFLSFLFCHSMPGFCLQALKRTVHLGSPAQIVTGLISIEGFCTVTFVKAAMWRHRKPWPIVAMPPQIICPSSDAIFAPMSRSLRDF